MILSMCQSKISLKRQTSLLKDSTTVVASFALDRSPTRKTCLLVEFAVAVTGTITISGSLDSSPVSETLSISSSTFKNSIKMYDSITSIALDATIVASGTTVTVKSIGRNGLEQAVETTIIASYPAQFIRQKSVGFDVKISGSVEKNMPLVIIPYTSTFTPQDADLVTNSGTGEIFFVVGNPYEEHYGMMKHYILKLQRKEQ